jgi:hypothetical protein
MCLKTLEEYDVAIDELWILASMPKKEQEPLYREWINARDHKRPGLAQGYVLRIGPDKERLVLCRNSFMNVLNLGRFRWITLNSTKLVLGANKHKNVESKNASASQETVDSVLFIFMVVTSSLVRTTRRTLSV